MLSISIVTFIVIAILHTCIPYVRTEPVAARYGAGCVYIEPKIYCYGGRLFSRDDSGQLALASNIFNSLDLSESRDLAALQYSWESIPHVEPEANYDFGIVAIPDHNAIFIDGGSGKDNPDGYKSKYNTTIYMVDDEQWNTDIESGHLHTSGHEAILGPGNIVYVWGGASYPDIERQEEALIYPLEMFHFHFQTLSWSIGPAVSSYQVAREWFSAALGSDGVSIYYVGGESPSAPRFENMTRYYYEPSPMNQILIFDTSGQRWRTENTTGVTPSTRVFHTLTLKPNTGELILFGGMEPRNKTEFREDYFYLLDTVNMEWSTRDISAPPGVAHVVTTIKDHSAVLVDNNLFIIFGLIRNQQSTSDVRVLDTELWSWRASISGVSDSTDMPPDSDSSGSGLSPGAIAGAIVGSVAAVVIIGAVVIFCYLRKRRHPRKKQEESNVVNETRSKGENQEHGLTSNPRSPNDISTANESTTKASSSEDPNRGNPSNFYGTEKPDGAPRLVMIPVKPDGVQKL
ncbi:hypothetical protein BJV82DRAFT_590348 [Fennellomyces sp. T-0311]|nr:hypothetical protein BJV82DRAFT_590348 [Fennellomyces sp. T-0311]